jgi:hypothetical protein
MNYLFMMKSYLENTIPWSLDYSGSQLATLDELRLNEARGFGDRGAAGASTHTLINVADMGLPPDIRPVPVLPGQPVDFNGNGIIDTDPDSVDLNHFPVPGPTPGQRLLGYDDWSNISLALVGSVNFGDGIGEGGASADEFNSQDYEALRQLYESVPSVVARESIPDGPTGTNLSVFTWPNPVRTQANVRYYVPTNGFVRVSAYDLLGRRVATIVDDYHTPGRYAVSWEPVNTQTRVKLATGVYVIRITLAAPYGTQYHAHPLVLSR